MSPPTVGGSAGRGLPITVFPSLANVLNVGLRLAALASLIGVGGCSRQLLKPKLSSDQPAGKFTTSTLRTTVSLVK